MINVEKTIYYLQDQFESFAIEDLLNYLIPEYEFETGDDVNETIVREER